MKATLVIPFLLLVVCSGHVLISNSYNRKAAAELGKKLFNEKILSKDSSVSCSGCHRPSHAFSDTIAFSIGINGTRTKRNTPSVLNMANRPYFFWDGRALSLESQALMPIENPNEMGLPIEEAIERLNQSRFYVNAFKKVFNEKPTIKNLAIAIAAFEKTLETSNSKFDDWSNNKGKLTAAEERGRQLFIGRAKCFNCHSMEDFTDDEFKNIGLFDGKENNDSGRYLITKNLNDVGKFKTPGLRNISVTAPYMHDGRFQTLEQVLAYYNNPGHFIDEPLYIDKAIENGIKLSVQEKKDIIAFLHTLTDRKYLSR